MPARTALGSAIDVAAAQRAYEAAQVAFDEAAQDERAHFERWQDSFGASEVARDEAARAWRTYQTAVGSRADGRTAGRPAGFGAGRALRRDDDNDMEVVAVNARQRRQAAEFVAAGGSFESYSPWDRLGSVARRLLGLPVRPSGPRLVRVPAVGRWSR